jgi:hypothetical protein
MHVLGRYKNPRKVNYWTLVGGGATVRPSPMLASTHKDRRQCMWSEAGWIVCLVYLVYLVCLVAGSANPPGGSKDRETKEEGGLEGLPPTRAQQGSSDSLYLSLKEWPRLPFTARIERAQFHRARSASKKGTWPLLPHPSKLARYLFRDGG